MTKSNFNIFNNKINNHTEALLFKQFRNAVQTSCRHKRPQAQLEKLVNAYQLKKQEKIIEFNPILENNIQNVLLKIEYTYFSLNYKFILDKLYSTNDNKFSLLFDSPKDLLNTLFPVNVVFNIYINTYIGFISDIPKASIAKEANFLSLLINNLLSYFDYQLKNEQAKLYLIHYAQFNKKNLLELKRNVLIFFKNQKYDLEHWEFYIVFIVNLNSNFKKVFQTLTIQEKSELYKFEKTKFLNFFEQKRNLYFKLFYKLGFLVNEFFVNNKLLIKIKTKNRKNSYMYEKIFNLKIVNRIDSILQINQYLVPSSAKGREWNINGQNGGYIYTNMSLDNNLAKKLKSGFSTFNYSFYTIAAMNAFANQAFAVNLRNLDNFDENFKKRAAIKNSEELFLLWIQCINFFFLLKRRYSQIKFNYLIYKNELFSLKSTKTYKIKSKIDKLLILKKFNEKYQITEDFLKQFYNYFNKYSFFFKSLIAYKEYTIIQRFPKTCQAPAWYPAARLTYCGRLCHLESIIPSKINPIYFQVIQNGFFDFTYDKITFDNLKIYIIVLLYRKKTLGFTLSFYLNSFKQNIEKKELFFIKRDYKLILYYIKEFQKKKLHVKKKLISYWNLVKNLILQMTVNTRNLLVNALIDYFSLKINFFYQSQLLVTLKQNYCSFQIYSLLSGDSNLANLTNLFSKKKADLYLDFLHKFKKALNVTWQNSFNENKLSLINNFDLYFTKCFFSKLILKSIFYKKGDNMIINIIKTLDKKLIDIQLNISLSKIIKDIINVHYNKTDDYQNTLIAINKILYKNNSEIKFKTLDGSFITYKHTNAVKLYNKIWSKNQNRYIFYKVPLAKNNIEENKISIKNVETFIQNFVYTLEGALWRIILMLFYKLYDSFRSLSGNSHFFYQTFQVPFVLYPHLQNIIKYVYIYIFLNKYFHKYKMGLKKYEYNDHPFIENNEIILKKSQTDTFVKLRYIYKLELNSENYLEYNSYFNFLLTDSNLDVLNYCFLNYLNISNKNDLKKINLLIENLQKQINQNDENETKKIILKIISSDFLFFFK